MCLRVYITYKGISNMTNLLQFTILAASFLLVSIQSFSQSDPLRNPMIARLPNYQLMHSEKQFDEIEVQVSTVERINVSGEKTFAEFAYDPNAKFRHPAQAQILKTYGETLQSLGGQLLARGPNYMFYRTKLNQKEYIAAIEVFESGKKYCVVMVERELLQNFIPAQEMFKGLSEAGRVTLYISFASGSSQIPNESLPSIDEIVRMMVRVPTLKVKIEGHTDNVGSKADNKALSEDRAKAVVEAIVKKGIDRSRLTAIGVGDADPIADNSTEKGRLQNRRVEIVKAN